MFIDQELKPSWAKNATRQVVELMKKGLDENEAFQKIMGIV